MDVNFSCCDICLMVFSADATPRIMPCGHSCCTSCIKKILESNKMCHMCRAVLPHSDFQHYPVSFSLLGMCAKLVDKKLGLERVKNRLQKAMEKHAAIKIFVIKLDTFAANGLKLRELSQIEDSNLSVCEMNEAIDLIEKQMMDVAGTYHIHLEANTNLRIDIHSSQYSDGKEYLSKIRREIALGGQVVAVSIINCEEKFAKIKIIGSNLFLHAFDKCDNADGKVVRVDFQDLQANILSLSSNLNGFLLLDDNPKEVPYMAFIEIFTSVFVHRGIQFLKLCSGELGVSYKGFSCKKVFNVNNVFIGMQITDFEFQAQEADKYQSFCENFSRIRHQQVLDLRTYLYCVDNGSFEFKNQYTTGNEIGKLTEYLKNRNLDIPLKIVDCGIAVTLPP